MMSIFNLQTIALFLTRYQFNLAIEISDGGQIPFHLFTRIAVMFVSKHYPDTQYPHSLY